MKILFLLLIFKLANSSEGIQDFKNITAYEGFPLGIVCKQVTAQKDDDSASRESNYPDKEDKAQCVITKDGKTLFNETLSWKNLATSGTFETAGESWNGAKVSVLVRFGEKLDQAHSSLLTVNVIAPVELDCSNVEKISKKEVIYYGEENHQLGCSAPKHMRMSESQYNSITTVWYHNCEKIKRDDADFEYGKVTSEEYTLFENLVIRNASLRTTPGRYHCILQSENKKLIVVSYQVCMCSGQRNSPEIVAGKKEYMATPGSSINVTCSGNTASLCNSLSQTVKWSKYKDNNGSLTDTSKCFDIMPTAYSIRKNCSSILHGKHCEPVSFAELKAAEMFTDQFTATYTLRDLTEADSGLYKCRLRTTGNPMSSNFTVVVKESLEGKTSELTIALAVTGGCLVIVAVLIILFRIYMTPIRYFFKHHFTPYEINDRQYVAYVVYAADVFKNKNSNMLKDAYQYFDRLSQLIYDPNNNAIEPISDSVIEVLERCMTAILFVTPQLLDNDGNYEIKEVYQALERNIARLNMRLVFICTEGTKKIISKQAKEGNEFCVMLRAFIGRKENTVILWKDNHQAAFRRALYVAMPKVKTAVQARKIQNETAI